MRGQAQEAEQKFSELLRKAEEVGPQVVTRHGEEVAVLISAEAYRKLSGVPDFKEFLLSGPDLSKLDLERSKEPTRVVEL